MEEQEQFVHRNLTIDHHLQQGGSIIPWDGIISSLISVYRKLNGKRYRDDILETIVTPFAAQVWDEFALMHDNTDFIGST